MVTNVIYYNLLEYNNLGAVKRRRERWNWGELTLLVTAEGQRGSALG
jgi:hypothetical protein